MSETTSSKSEAGAPAVVAEQALFRPQVLSEQQTCWLGTVAVKPRLAHRWYAAFSLLIVAAIAATLLMASYTRKARVAGWLVPEQGMIRVHSPRVGVATRLMVREGDPVSAGQALVALSGEERSVAVGETNARVARELQAQRASLDAEQARAAQSFGQQRAMLAERIAAARAEQDNMVQEIALQKRRVALARTSEKRLDELRARGFISAQQVQTTSEAALDQAGKLRSLERALSSLGRERMALESELNDMPLKLATQNALAARNTSAIDRELAEVAAKRELLVTAPQAGTVTAIHISRGAAVGTGTAMLSIVPRGATLEAQLYASSRAIGFVRPQQPVQLRYLAYPYQKFGHYQGTIKSISRTGIEPAELPAQFRAAAGAGMPGEALYRITVTLARQDVTAYGARMPLAPGMQLDADILLERRRLYEWVLDPVYTITGRLGR
ncbi:HlyD family efflux transporter periplasmic adaptor subunit [Massilia sp. DJPM01]|uniref:HlyD family secretion protein n=1 Tax=Massilia sp. DJPM01 TaxID=3024404 RepID=UPI00259F3FD5|nr:HlyD family efflux transporter periplasmic adaptor subunit [Massilia sp. DJPM01]MDM5176968.1 HlyD family efflux transporter periplasmic adaptor subunit [Massilia sp. DJPM01]